ncbi:Kinesin light chain, partial [Penicillium subrubescens]
SMESLHFGDGNSGAQVGINNGVINLSAGGFPKAFDDRAGLIDLQRHALLDRPETRPEPFSTVPFPHDPDFVSRDRILNQIHEKSSVPGSKTVLVGLGGVGLGITGRRVQSTDTWVFWVHASTAARCEESLRDLVNRAQIPGRQDHKANIFQLFGNWLQDGNIGEWILVLDNVDDDELLRKPLATRTEAQAIAPNHASTQPLLRYLLKSSNGSVIITSRNKGIALEIAGLKNLIDVQPMDMTEALDLIQNKLDPGPDRADLVELVEELEFMPLAIVQAASYITVRSPRCSVSQYLEKLRQSDRRAAKLLNHEGNHMHRDWEAKNSILLTWQISFDHIRRRRQSAADLLSLMSFFDWQGIPEDLLRVQGIEKTHKSLGASGRIANSFVEEDTESSSECDLEDDFESDIATLRDYSFIAISENNMVFTMHRLVQLMVRTWLKSHGQDKEWKKRFINNLYAEFPTGEYANWEKCQSLFPHVKSAVSHRPESQDSLRKWATLLYNGAWYARESGNFAELRDMASKSQKQRALLLGSEDEQTLRSTTMLAHAHRLEGRWKEAEQLEVQVMETRKTKLGVDHPSTLTSMANLGSTYRDQGRWEEAEPLDVQVMEMSKTKLGVDHPSTLTSMANLGSTYRDQGRWEEAEPLDVQVMEMSKTKLGVDHPNTLTRMANLASTFWNQGRWEEAEQLDMQVMQTIKTKLGVDHPNTLTSMANLGLTYRNQGRWEEAEKLLVQVMETSKTKLGVDHPSTLTSMANLASTFWNQGRWKEAEKLFVQVLETSKTKLGVDHPNTLTSMANLASTYRHQGRWEEAEQLDVQVMETSKTKLGVDHPDTLTSMANLASTFWNQGRWEEAEQLFVQVIETSKTKLGVDHPDTLTSMANLASTHLNQGRWEEAEQLFVQVIETSKTKLGADHPSTLTSMANLGSTYRDQGRWEEAEPLDVQVMETSKTKLGADHPDTLTSMANLAHTLRSSGRDSAALQLMAECVRLRDRKLGPDHPHTISSKSILSEWGEKGHSPTSQVTKAPTETKEDHQTLASSTETSERVIKPRGHRRLIIFSRLFGRN